MPFGSMMAQRAIRRRVVMKTWSKMHVPRLAVGAGKVVKILPVLFARPKALRRPESKESMCS